MFRYLHHAGEAAQVDVLIVNPRIAVATKDAYAALTQALWFMARNASSVEAHYPSFLIERG